MHANNIRRNPFLIAPSLTLFVLLSLGIIGLVPLNALGSTASYIVMMLLTALVFGLPTAAFLYFRGNALPHFGFRKMTGEGLSVSLWAAAVLILLSVVIRGGLFGDAYNYKAYTLYGSVFENTPASFGEGILLFFAFVLFPVLLEGVFFRGILAYEYRHGGFWISAFLPSLFYGMTAMEFSRFPMQFLLGFLLSAVVFITGNLWYSMLSHAVYAVFALFFEKYFIFIAKEPEARTLFFFVFIALGLLSLFAFIRSSEQMLRKRGEDEDAMPIRMPKSKKPLVLYDIFSAPMLWADIFCFALFAVLQIFI